jgi:hypothetical protein
MANHKFAKASMAVLASTLLDVASAIPAIVSRQTSSDPFAPIDPQNWVSKSLIFMIVEKKTDFCAHIRLTLTT